MHTDAMALVTLAMFLTTEGAGLTFDEILSMGADALDFSAIGLC